MTASPEALDMAAIAARAADDKLATDIVVLDVSGQLVITDAFVLASAETERQVNAVVEEIEDKLSTIEYVKEVVVYDEDGYITAEFFLDTVDTPDAKDRIKADVNEINRKMPTYKQVTRVKTRDTEFPKTTTLKILRNYNK